MSRISTTLSRAAPILRRAEAILHRAGVTLPLAGMTLFRAVGASPRAGVIARGAMAIWRDAAAIARRAITAASELSRTDHAEPRSVALRIEWRHPLLPLLAVLTVASHASAQSHYTAVDTSIPGNSSPTGVNNLGQVVANASQPYLWSLAGGLQALALSNPSSVYGINDSGQVVGTEYHQVIVEYYQFGIRYDVTWGFQVACRWTAATGSSALGSVPSGLITYFPTNSVALAINNSGLIVGRSEGALGAVMWSNGSGSPSSLQVGSGSSANAVSPNGQFVAGSFNAADGYSHSFLWSVGGAWQDLGAIGSCGSTAHGVNDHGQVVGQYQDCGHDGPGGFSWTSTGGARRIYQTIGGANRRRCVAMGISNDGVIVGSQGGDALYNIHDIGFVDIDGSAYDLNWLNDSGGVAIGSASAISSEGVIIGERENGTVVVLTPCQPHIQSQPSAFSTCPFGTSILSVSATGSGPIAYQWQIQDASGTWANLTDGPLVVGGVNIGTSTGATERTWHTVLVASAGGVNRLHIRCNVSNTCGSVTSNEAVLTICPADFNCSGSLTINDIFDFLSAWFASDPRADFNGVNGITVQDIFDFLAAWFAGCP